MKTSIKCWKAKLTISQQILRIFLENQNQSLVDFLGKEKNCNFQHKYHWIGHQKEITSNVLKNHAILIDGTSIATNHTFLNHNCKGFSFPQVEIYNYMWAPPLLGLVSLHKWISSFDPPHLLFLYSNLAETATIIIIK